MTEEIKAIDPTVFSDWENGISAYKNDHVKSLENVLNAIEDDMQSKIDEAYRVGCAVVLDEVRKDSSLSILPNGQVRLTAFPCEEYEFTHEYNLDEAFAWEAGMRGLDEMVAWLEKRIEVLKENFE